MKDKNRKLRKVLSLILSFAIILPATVSLGGDSGQAQAKTSLPYIENLKTTSSTFNILEIVPAAGQGSIGYYIDGQEPCANWTYDAAAISGQSARQTSVRNRFAMLQTLKILGATTTDTTTPLAYTGQYTEVYPWVSHDGYTKLTLSSAEQTTAKGTFTPAANGAYTQSTGFTMQTNGSYVQVIKYFAAGTIGTGQYYYVPTFAPVSGTLPDNTAVYTNTATINDPSATPATDGYVYYGTTGANFEGMEIGTSYYYVTSYSAPSTTKTAGAYVGISDSYRLKTAGETGYFVINAAQLIYTFVGSGGTYNFNYDASSTTTNNIICNTVYYTGGYTNNNWFLKNVFDWDVGDAAPNIKFKVTSVVGNSVTAAQVSTANLIVLTYGFNPTVSTGTPTAYSSTTDISAAVSTAISTAVSSNVPIIVDYRLRSISTSVTNLRALARTLYTNNVFSSYTTFVKNNVFFFTTDTTRTALVTNQFSTLYTASYYNVSTGQFYAAYEVAVYENFIRDEEGSTAGYLETDVNMARAIRYIINYKGRRVENGKSSINVLEIEPNNTQRLTQSSYQTLTGYTGAVTITCVSTLEFVGKSDDLIENYDAIYIGDNGGNSLSDSKLDGDYLYENIGAPVTIRADAVGLTDAEYSSDTTFTGTDGNTYSALKDPQTTRYSGNDLSTKKLAALNDYAVAGHPVIIADSLACQYSINAAVSGVQSADGTSAILTASASVMGVNPATSGPYYTWYKKNTDDSYSQVGTLNSTSNTYTATSGEYYCRIRYTISGSYYYAYSDSIIVTTTDAQTAVAYSSSSTNGIATLTRVSNGHTYTYTYSVNISDSSGTLTATATNTSGSAYTSPYYSYQWFNSAGTAMTSATGGTTATTNSYTPTVDDTYYCSIYVTRVAKSGTDGGTFYLTGSTTRTLTNTTNGRTRDAVVDYTAAVTTVTPGTTIGSPITASATAGQAYYIDDSVVDNCSNMYSFLNTNKSRGNVMRSGAIDEDALLRYTNTSKPKINLISYPAVYARSATAPYTVTSQLAQDPGSNPATYTLKYDFTITNPTDTTPDATEYYCNLYIDTDSDSRFIEQERIGNIEIHEATSGVAGALVDSGTLKAGQEYIVTRTLSAGMDGFLPWKLELIKVSDESVHTSYTNYTYVKPTAEKINILQINTGSGGIGLSLDTTRPTISDTSINATRNKILDLLSNDPAISSISSDYDIKIQTITTTQAQNITSVPITNTLVKDTSGNLHAPYTDIKQLIYSYDMVIIGFEDCYRELDEETSAAIVDYLKDNHPILYSHDTTSMSNVPLAYDASTISGSSNYQSTGTYWGYYFNSVLRDPLGLDRYGITNSVFGLTSKSSPLPITATSGLVAAGYSGLGSAVTSQATPITPAGTTVTSQVLTDEGYSIAYQPGSNTAGTGGSPIGTTQGFTNYMYSGNMTSTAVTQVNKGMITTYPFDLNLTSGSTMTILDTHQQYYQANMNPDDVLVWYCLSGSGYDYNDAASAYYIFSNGNATYSGFGHDLSNIGLPEAKLFVNSIIAAYRITNFPPVVTFTDATGNNKLNAFLIPADSDGTLLLPAAQDASTTDTSRYLYFTVDDSNVAKDKTVKAVVSYINPTDPNDPATGTEVTPTPHVPIYNSQTNEVATDSNLVSGLAYYVKIDDILNELADSGITIGEKGIQAQVTATTHVRGQDLPSVTEPILLRKLVLFDLG